MQRMDVASPPERLTPEELAFVPPPEEARHFKSLIAEYETAMESGDEGWIADPLQEIRKFIGGVQAKSEALAAENHLADVGRVLARPPVMPRHRTYRP